MKLRVAIPFLIMSLVVLVGVVFAAFDLPDYAKFGIVVLLLNALVLGVQVAPTIAERRSAT